MIFCKTKKIPLKIFQRYFFCNGLWYFKKNTYLCSQIRVSTFANRKWLIKREFSENLKQSRCCEFQKSFQTANHWLKNWEGIENEISQKTCLRNCLTKLPSRKRALDLCLKNLQFTIYNLQFANFICRVLSLFFALCSLL